MTDEQKKRLEQKLWDIANTLRGKMGADEFRDYILGFIFYKYLSEKMDRYANKILAEDGIEYLDVREGSEDGDAILEAVRDEAVEQLGYFLKPSELFEQIAERGNSKGAEGSSRFILDDLQQILTSIEQSTMGTDSEDDFDKLFEDLDLTSSKLGRTAEAKNDLISKVLVHLAGIDFELDKADSDVLGDAYEYLIGKFASGAGKKAGEFYTPREVSTILAQIVTTGKQRLKSIYDPTCGSGSLLLRVAREVEKVDSYYGQEMNRTTFNLARMNMLLHDIHYSRFDLRQEDTLAHPQHDLDQRFEAVVANPPFSAKWSANDNFLADDRFSQYGRLAPGSKADFAFVQHMLHHLAENGTMAVILPHGVLFRGGAEGHIRKYLIEEKNWLDAVIGLPANIFYGTSIPTCILVFKKCREQPEDVLFIDASSHFEKAKNQNYLRGEDIDRIVSAYRERTERDKFSHRASMAEIAENDFNLNLPRYVDTFEEDEQVDLDAVLTGLKVIDSNMERIDKTIASFCEALGIEAPDGPNAALLRLYKKAMMQRLFSGGLRFASKDGSPFPNWHEKRLGDLANFFRGSNLSKSDLDKEGQYPAIHYGELFTVYSEVIFDIKSKTHRADCTPSVSGDVLMPSSDVTPDGLARGSTIKKSGVMLGGDINIIRPNESLDSTYLSYWIGGHRKRFMRLVSGTTVKHLYLSDLKSIAISLPHSEEQQKIADFLSALDAKIDAVARQIDAMQDFKKGSAPADVRLGNLCNG